MGYYKNAPAVQIKLDKSPVTKADIEANHLIVSELLRLFPDVPVVSEEASENHHLVPACEYFWLVDPLDGTKSFIRKSGEFTVNIGLIHNCRPVFGVIYAPVKNELYYTDAENNAWKISNGKKQKLEVSRPNKDAGFSFVVSHSHNDPATEKYLEKYKVAERKSGSSSYKFCMIAEGIADIYPRFGPTMEWDTAAGHAIVNAAGGEVTNIDGSPFLYAKPDFRNGGFVAKSKNL